jgi:hypothetical protein
MMWTNRLDSGALWFPTRLWRAVRLAPWDGEVGSSQWRPASDVSEKALA